MNSGDKRKSMLDMWISGPHLRDKWIQVQREFDELTGVPFGNWPTARWDHQCVGIQTDFETTSTTKENISVIHNTSLPSHRLPRLPFTMITMGGYVDGRKGPVLTNEVWNFTFPTPMIGWPIIGQWQKINVTLGYREAKTFQRAGHCALSITTRGYQPTIQKNWKDVSIEPSDEHPSIQAARDPAYKNEVEQYGTMKKKTLIFLIAGFGANDIFLNDVWMSSDRGMSWSRRSRGRFPARYFHGCGMLGHHSLVVFGGRERSSTSVMNDVHVTTNYGISWRELRPVHQSHGKRWEPRYRFSVVSFVSKLEASFEAAAQTSQTSQTSQDAQSAAAQQSAQPGSGVRTYTSESQQSSDLNLRRPEDLIESKHFLALVGGYSSGTSTFFSDMWVTNDGISWTKQMMDTPMFGAMEGRSGHTTHLIPGSYSDASTFAKTDSGSKFYEEEFPERTSQILPSPKLVVVGGRTVERRLSDLWTRDGPILLTSRAANSHVLSVSILVLISILFFLNLFLFADVVDAYVNEDVARFQKEAKEFAMLCNRRDDSELKEHVVPDNEPTFLPVSMQQHFDDCNLPRAVLMSKDLILLCEALLGSGGDETSEDAKGGGGGDGSGGDEMSEDAKGGGDGSGGGGGGSGDKRPNINDPKVKITLLMWNGETKTARAPGRAHSFLQEAEDIEKRLERKLDGLSQAAEQMQRLANDMNDFLTELVQVGKGSGASGSGPTTTRR